MQAVPHPSSAPHGLPEQSAKHGPSDAASADASFGGSFLTDALHAIAPSASAAQAARGTANRSERVDTTSIVARAAAGVKPPRRRDTASLARGGAGVRNSA